VSQGQRAEQHFQGFAAFVICSHNCTTALLSCRQTPYRGFCRSSEGAQSSQAARPHGWWPGSSWQRKGGLRLQTATGCLGQLTVPTTRCLTTEHSITPIYSSTSCSPIISVLLSGVPSHTHPCGCALHSSALQGACLSSRCKPSAL
jgi:hypothetical protein